VANFAEKGLGVQQLVALSGAHTIGEAARMVDPIGWPMGSKECPSKECPSKECPCLYW
jgi:hypothetical protein